MNPDQPSAETTKAARCQRCTGRGEIRSEPFGIMVPCPACGGRRDPTAQPQTTAPACTCGAHGGRAAYCDGLCDIQRIEAEEARRECERYACGLFTEECGEVLQAIGKRDRFGMDTPGVKDPLTGIVDMSLTPRTALQKELGDVLAAVEYAVQRGVLDGNAIIRAKQKKLAKLLDPDARDNLGRRLAP